MSALPSPPVPLHSEVSLQSTVTAAEPDTLHLAAVSQATVQAPAQVALQSTPAAQVQVAVWQAQPAPVHWGAGPASS